ncbi:hypothetical protein [Sphingomonas sp. RS2018]
MTNKDAEKCLMDAASRIQEAYIEEILKVLNEAEPGSRIAVGPFSKMVNRRVNLPMKWLEPGEEVPPGMKAFGPVK